MKSTENWELAEKFEKLATSSIDRYGAARYSEGFESVQELVVDEIIKRHPELNDEIELLVQAARQKCDMDLPIE